jgi:hypothetical protein
MEVLLSARESETKGIDGLPFLREKRQVVIPLLWSRVGGVAGKVNMIARAGPKRKCKVKLTWKD